MITDALQIHITFQVQLTMYLLVNNFYCKKEPINLHTVTFSNKLLFKLSSTTTTAKKQIRFYNNETECIAVDIFKITTVIVYSK